MSTLLDVNELVVSYRRSFGPPTPVLHGVSFKLERGEVLSIVGESGAGKTTLVNALLKLVPTQSGAVDFDGISVLTASQGELRRLRRNVQVVFQNPFASLNPRLRVIDAVSEPVRTHTRLRGTALADRALAALADVGLGREHLDRYPHQLSGGQAQRVAIARALVLEPKMLILDEPTSSLDVSVQAQVLNLLIDLREEKDLTYLFISHDLAVVRHLSDRVAVMKSGRILEEGLTSQVLDSPRHTYTRSLVESTPSLA